MRTALLSIILFLSGCAALIFETLWLRLTGLVFGNSIWSATLILSSFMAGLAIGNAVAAGRRRSLGNPLRFYAALEITIAVCGCALVLALPQLGVWLRPLFQALWNHEVTINALRLVFSFLLLLLPTTAMGLTLPVVLADEGLASRQFGSAIGSLYGWNTLGAVTGALLGELLLVPALGLWGTAIAAAVFNVAAAAFALGLSRGSVPRRTKPAETCAVGATNPMLRRLLFVCAATGALLLGLEVVWFRFLRLFVAVSATAFALMLAVVLAGIGLGAIASGWLHRRTHRSDELLPMLLLGAGAVTLVSYLLFPIELVQRHAGSFYLDRWTEIGGLSLALMFPSAVLSGIIFPTIASVVQSNVGARMRSAGLVTLWNTIGAAIGPWLAGFVLLPAIGFERTLVLCAASYAVLAVIVVPLRQLRLKNVPGLTGLSLAALVILLLIFFPYKRDEQFLANPRLRFEENEGEHLVRKIEGPSDTFQLLRADFLGQPYYYRLLTNAFSMSATTPQGQRYMRLFAYLPLSFQPQAHDALLICFGLGATADALVRDQQLQKIDIVDIAPEVFALADDRVGRDYANPLTDKRVTRYVQDGRFFLQSTPNKYDVITGEPPPPKVIGAVNLYTREFFMSLRSRLNPDGVASFWLPIYQMRIDEVKAILHAFHDAFDNATVWAGPDEEWIMVGINGSGHSLSAGELGRLWNQPETKADLLRIGIEVPEQLGSLFVMSAEEIDSLASATLPLTDNFPKRLSDRPADVPAIHRFAWGYLEGAPAARRFRRARLIEDRWPASVIGAADPFFSVREERFLSTLEKPDRFAELDFYLRRTRLRVPVLETLNSDEFRQQIVEEMANADAGMPDAAVWELTAGALARRDYRGAIDLLEGKRTRRNATMTDIYLLIYLYCLTGEIDKANALAAADTQPLPNDRGQQDLWRKLQAEFGFHPPP